MTEFEQQDLTPLSYELDDARTGERQRMVQEGDGVRMSHKENTSAETKSDVVDLKAGSLIGDTLAPFLQRNWELLAEGNTLEFPLLVPARRDVFSFRVRRVEPEWDIAPGRMVVKMEPDTWILRLAVDPLYFTFGTDPPHRLMEYRGRGVISTASGETQDLRITYVYEEGG